MVKFRDNQMLGTVLVVGAVSAVGYSILLNMREHKADRAMANARGAENATSFAETFPTEAERTVALALYPRLQKLTLTGELPFLKEDLLFSPAYSLSIVSDEAAAHHLNFDHEDLWDNVVAVLAELDCDAPKTVIGDELQDVKPIGQLESALAKLTSKPAIR
jgi:hypothetical protein